MEPIRTKIKKWGNSFGIIIPSEVVAGENLKEGSQIRVLLESESRMNVGDVLKLAKKMKLKKRGDTQKILDEIDKEFEPD